jgi:hypothetical protein
MLYPTWQIYTLKQRVEDENLDRVQPNGSYRMVLQMGERAKAGCLGIKIMCPSGATCLPTDCCFSELALYKSNSMCWSSTKRTSSSSH